ncbi:MAG: transglycosylase domain-containing protein [Clostridia bacterium]|nr:transglycosylase domain-containing protein [Clostridia bacterium]
MKKREKKRKKKGFWKGLLKFFTVTALILTVTATIVGLVFAIYIEKNIEKSVDETLFAVVGAESATKLYYYDFSDRENRVGEAVEISEEELYGGYRCEYVEYERVPTELISAFVSIEDKRFYEHSGVDWKRTLSAGINYFLKFSDSYGGSTITQQLIKNVTQNDDYSFQRKIQEIFWALDLETKMSKHEILEMYLNIINLSQGCYGVQAASEYYFSKDVSELTLNECACIAAITNSPSYYNPIKNPENNRYRRELILTQMYEQGYISYEAYTKALSEELVLNVNEDISSDNVNSWYADMVIEDVINDLVEEKGYSRQMANLMIYTGGLKIYTVMDIDVQKQLEEYYADTSNFFSVSSAENPQSSMIIIDTATGDILGVAGAVGEKSGNRVQNFATQTLRPAGSVIKPLSVYAPALEEGIINWSSVYDDVPVNFGNYNTDITAGEIVEPKAWPKNSSGIYRGLTNINYAIEHSVNTVVVRVLEELGLDNSFDFLYDKLHMESIIEREELSDGSIITDKDYAALALGQFNYGVTVREITAAYSVLANNGVYNGYRSYLKVTDSKDNEILNNDYNGEIVLSEETASLMTMMLGNVIENGTAKAVTLDESVDCAGKTGTTQNNYDRWFIGYTPYYICGTWYGYEYPKAITDSSNPCITFWDEVMCELHEEYISSGEELKSFYESPNIVEAEYCMDSGMLMTEACRNDPRGDRSETGYFIKGGEPTSLCTCHVSVPYDTVCGGVASEDCPNEHIKNVGLINVVRVFPTQIYVTDAQYVWRDIGRDILPVTSPELPFFANILGEGEYSGISRVSEQYNRYCRYDFSYYNWLKRREE